MHGALPAMPSDPIILSIAEELRRRLEQAAREDQQSLDGVAEAAIEAHLERRRVLASREAAIVAAALAERARGGLIDECTMDEWVAQHCAADPKEPPDGA